MTSLLDPATTARLRRLWSLDPEVTFLNHGSFGACPREVLDAQQRWRDELEREPVHFMLHTLEPALDRARGKLADFVGADAEDIAFVANATTGVNAVLQSMPLSTGDDLLVTNHAYNACRNALDQVAARHDATITVVDLPFPVRDPGEIVDVVLAATNERTRLALLDHVTSPTALVLPLEILIGELRERGVETLVDGAHAPGMLALDLRALGAAYYTGNCHKWICAPKGAGFLWVRRDLQAQVRPTVISHGASGKRTDRSRFLAEFDWTGTHDPTAYLTVPDAIDCIGGLLPGGWPAVRAQNRALALAARAHLCAALEIEPPAPEALIGSLATLPLPGATASRPRSWQHVEPLGHALTKHFGIQVPVFPWPAPPRLALRISAQLYNDLSQYEELAAALTELLGSGG